MKRCSLFRATLCRHAAAEVVVRLLAQVVVDLHECGERAHAQSFDLGSEHGDLLRLSLGHVDHAAPLHNLLLSLRPIRRFAMTSCNRDTSRRVRQHGHYNFTSSVSKQVAILGMLTGTKRQEQDQHLDQETENLP